MTAQPVLGKAMIDTVRDAVDGWAAPGSDVCIEGANTIAEAFQGAAKTAGNWQGFADKHFQLEDRFAHTTSSIETARAWLTGQRIVPGLVLTTGPGTTATPENTKSTQKEIFALDPSGRRRSDSAHELHSRVATTFLKHRASRACCRGLVRASSFGSTGAASTGSISGRVGEDQAL